MARSREETAMTAQGDASLSSHPRRNCYEELEDEVYRQMFRLEATRPGAEISLAIALLRAWLTADSVPEMSKFRSWLKIISPICILMIEAAQQANCSCEKCPQ